MRHPQHLCVALACLAVAASGTAQGAAKRRSPLERLLTAPEKYHTYALVNYIDAQIATRTISANQYAALRKLDWDVTSKLLAWVTEPPMEAEDRSEFSLACIRALRDVVPGNATPGIRAVLAKVAGQRYGQQEKDAAAYALAQFGDTSFVDKTIAKYLGQTKDPDATRQARAWQSLASIYARMRRYTDAIHAYRQVFTLIDGGDVRYPPGALPIWMYNAACSMALAGKKDAALAQLKRALATGKKSGYPLRKSLLELDTDIDSLRGDPRFAALFEQYFGKR